MVVFSRRAATGLRSFDIVSRPSRAASNGILPPPAAGSSTVEGVPIAGGRNWNARAVALFGRSSDVIGLAPGAAGTNVRATVFEPNHSGRVVFRAPCLSFSWLILLDGTIVDGFKVVSSLIRSNREIRALR
jgi:hypothetical protein